MDTSRNSVASAILAGPHRVLGENLHPQYSDSGASSSKTPLGELKNRLVLLNFKLIRGVATTAIDSMMQEIFSLLSTCPTDTVPNDMIVKLMILAAYQRDIKDGKGERDVFYQVVFNLWRFHPDATSILLREYLPSAGACWKDVPLMMEKLIVEGKTDSHISLADLLFNIMLNVAKDEQRIVEGGKPATLVLKWLPRQQSHFDKEPLKLATRFAHALFPGETDHQAVMAKYRRMLSKGSRLLNTVETKMCANEWDAIEPGKVPAKAMKTYRRAFMNVDKKWNQRSQLESRILLAKKLMDFILAGKMIHGTTLMPHEIISNLFRSSYDPVLEAQLKSMLNEFVESFPQDIGLVFPLCDVSGSMESRLGSTTKATCMDVAIALGFLLSQLPGPFHDKVMTFSQNPTIVDLSSTESLYGKIERIKKMNWGMNTDFGKAMDLILRSLQDNKADPASVADLTLIVFSDMQFDAAQYQPAQSRYGRSADSDPWDVAHENIEKMYAATGFPTPKIVYWNLNARDSAGHPAHAETKGVTMLSGFSQAALKSFLAGNLCLEDEEPTSEDEESNEDFVVVASDEADGGAASSEPKAKKAKQNPYDVLCVSLDKFNWLMKKFEQSGVFPGYVAPIEPDALTSDIVTNTETLKI